MDGRLGPQASRDRAGLAALGRQSSASLSRDPAGGVEFKARAGIQPDWGYSVTELVDTLRPPVLTPAAVVTLDPRTDTCWQSLVERMRSDVFHSPAWMRVLGDTYGLDVRAHLVLDDRGTPVGGLPFCHIHDMVGDRIVTMPFS